VWWGGSCRTNWARGSVTVKDILVPTQPWPIVGIHVSVIYFALNLASWSCFILNFVFMKNDTASSLVKDVMRIAYLSMCVDFQGSCRICHPSFTSCAVSCSVTDSQSHLGCVWQQWRRKHPSLGLGSQLHWMTFLGNLNVQLFQLHELLMVG
jgi:hypothetical protein